MVVTVDLTNDQKNADISIQGWYHWEKKQTYFLSGYAGTGKTTIIGPILNSLGLRSNEVAIACFTANAALVLADKLDTRLGLEPTTIHKLIYIPKESRNGEVRFSKKTRDKLKGIKLIIIDEASMISRSIYNDLLSYGIKVLFVGDIGQLQPVVSSKSDAVVFTKPDFMLMEIHRQAQENLLIMLSKAIRERTMWPPGVYGANGEVTILTRAQFEADTAYRNNCYYYADQIICGYNNTRQRINETVRALHGRDGAYPVPGDRLVSLTNKWDILIGGHPLVNGTTGRVGQVLRESQKSLWLRFTADRGNGKATVLEVAKSEFVGKKATPAERFSSHRAFLDYSYGITCHKSQGSEWDNVLVLNEVLDAESHEKWLYTAVTRAKRKLILVV